MEERIDIQVFYSNPANLAKQSCKATRDFGPLDLPRTYMSTILL